jgi:hypothetical protein
MGTRSTAARASSKADATPNLSATPVKGGTSSSPIRIAAHVVPQIRIMMAMVAEVRNGPGGPPNGASRRPLENATVPPG